MTRDITPSVRSWMAETIDTAPGPTRLYEHVASAVRSTPQQRGWLPPSPLRWPRADASALAAALVVAAAVVLGTFLFTGVQRGGVAAPGPSSSAIRTGAVIPGPVRLRDAAGQHDAGARDLTSSVPVRAG